METPNIPHGARVLRLTLKKQWFDLMVTGEKDTEFRKPTDFIKSRLTHKEGDRKEYDYVLFYNGYGAHLPWFLARYDGQGVADCPRRRNYGGHEVFVERGDYKIHLGPVLQSGNLKA